MYLGEKIHSRITAGLVAVASGTPQEDYIHIKIPRFDLERLSLGRGTSISDTFLEKVHVHNSLSYYTEYYCQVSCWRRHSICEVDSGYHTYAVIFMRGPCPQ
jgi:hypothetical protein